MSGFTRDSRHYGDQLVYEALLSKWDRYHSRCGCGQDWVVVHAEPAGFRVVRSGNGFITLVGPGLTEGVDETALTTNALWKAVTGTPGEQDWHEAVRVIARTAPEELDPAAEKARKAVNVALYAAKKAASEGTRTELLTAAQLSYLNSLVTRVSRERLDEQLTIAIKGNRVQPRQPGEKTQQMLERLTRDAARKLISALTGRR